MTNNEYFKIDEQPDIPGLKFRNYAGKDDLPLMFEVSEKEKKATQDDFPESFEDFKAYYDNLVNCDPFKHVLMAELDGKMIGYSRGWWTRKQMGGYNYNHFTILDPDHHGTGLRKAMLLWNEGILREIAATHPDSETREFQVWTYEENTDLISTLNDSDYKVARYGFEMVRDLSESIPELPLPPGIEARPPMPEEYRKVWEADIEASKDGWEPIEITEEFYKMWLASDCFQPDIFEVAWDGDRVAGAVQNFIHHASNEELGIKRGYTENIHVGREWRGQGVAKALIARSFRSLKEKGMEEASLGVDAENPTGALKLYEGMGFKVSKKHYTYRKPVFED